MPKLSVKIALVHMSVLIILLTVRIDRRVDIKIKFFLNVNVHGVKYYNTNHKPPAVLYFLMLITTNYLMLVLIFFVSKGGIKNNVAGST